MSQNISLSSINFSITTLADNHRLTWAQVTDFANRGYQKVYTKLVAAKGDDYNLSSTTFQTISNQTTYNLPADYMQNRGLEIYTGQGPTGYMTLTNYSFRDRNDYSYLNYQINPIFSGPYFRYHIQNSSPGVLSLLPPPNSSYTLQLWYTPVATTLVNAGDTFDAVNGYHDLAILYATELCLVNEESDTSTVERLILKEEARIDAEAASRDSGMPKIVAALSRRRGRGPFGGGFGGY